MKENNEFYMRNVLIVVAIIIILFYIVYQSNKNKPPLLDQSPRNTTGKFSAPSSSSSSSDRAKEAEYHLTRGLAYKIEDNDLLAIAEYNRAIDLKPDYAMAYYHRGLSKLVFSELKSAACNDFAMASRLGYSRADTVAAFFCK